jgi:hypothetical protein
MPSSNQDASIRWDSQVTSPFNTLSRRVYPRTVREVFAWAEELWMHHGTYSQAIKKAVRYFLTEIEIQGDSVDQHVSGQYSELLTENYDIMQELARVGDDYAAFGNSFTSLHVPFTRQLVCPQCYFRSPLTKMYEHFRWQSGEFTGKCPTCHNTVKYKREDTPLPSGKVTPVVTYWPPQYMEIKEHPLSRRAEYTLDIGRYEELRDGIMLGDPLFLEDTPWELVQAVIQNKSFKFAPSQVKHLKAPPITSMTPTLRGWGLPLFMAEFETALLVHMLDKYTESIMVDYLVPFRVLAPPQSSSASTDPMLQMDMGEFSSHVMSMIERHRSNPTGWNFLPVPLEYQVLGGEAKDLAPVEVMEFFEKRLLYSMGIPPELYKDGANASAGPILTFKMFEKTWQHYSNALNDWLTWLVRRQGEILNWESVKATLRPVSLHEDPEVMNIKLSLAASNEISRDTAYRPLGIDIKQERKKIVQEEESYNRDIEEREKEMEDEGANKALLDTPSASAQILGAEEQAAMEQEAAAGGGGMAPAMPMPSAPVAGDASTMEGLMAEAEQMANQIISMPPEARRSTLIDLKHSNETLHAQVKALITDMEQQAGQQGKMQLRSGEMPPAPAMA